MDFQIDKVECLYFFNISQVENRTRKKIELQTKKTKKKHENYQINIVRSYNNICFSVVLKMYFGGNLKVNLKINNNRHVAFAALSSVQKHCNAHKTIYAEYAHIPITRFRIYFW